jgi:hypothetical protein
MFCAKCNNPGEFYANDRTCKECRKRIVRENRKSRIDYYRAYDNARPRRGDSKKHRSKYPEKYKARTAVGNAVRDGRLTKEPCRICSNPRSTAHHEDYSKPLEVVWLCQIHHEAEHHNN